MSTQADKKARVVLITGAASGIGLELAQAFGALGDHVLLVDVNEDRLRDAEAALKEAGASCAGAVADISDGEQVAAAVQAADTHWSRLDVVINNAGISGPSALVEQMEEADLDRVLAINLKAPFLVCRHAVDLMRGTGGGSILNISSITAQEGSPLYPAYSAAKAGVEAMTRSLARRLGRYNIRVNCLRLGSIVGTRFMEAETGTAMTRQDWQKIHMGLLKKTPLPRLGRAQDVAHLATFLTSPQAAHIHGSVVTLDGGESLGYP